MTHPPYEYRGRTITIWTGENASGTYTWSHVIDGVEHNNIGGRVKTEKEAIRDAKLDAQWRIDQLE